ncbi:hypothetical protein JHK84_050353 [Glycine max]|nr:hypothetical protein JHK86_050291 [Glycine max]KAG5094765.1 hypothetical protein JHK84_050353 [Glycine max]
MKQSKELEARKADVGENFALGRGKQIQQPETREKNEKRRRGKVELRRCRIVIVTIKMATVQHLVMDNKKKRPIICRTKPDLNKTFKEATKAIRVA